VRRGAARPRRSDQAAAGETLSRAGRRPHRRACMGCRAPQAPSTRTRLGVPARGRSAWWPRRSGCRPRLRQPVHVLGQRPMSSVRCPVSGVSDQCPRLPVHGTDVQCPVRASERPGVRCPASAVRWPVLASGVCALPRPLCPAEVRSWSAAVGQAAVRLGWPGSAWSPASSMPGSSSAWVEPRARSWRRWCWAQPRPRFGPGRRRGRWLGSGQLDRVADQDRPGAREDRSLVGAGARRGSPSAAG
jgi:hypothetical protein